MIEGLDCGLLRAATASLPIFVPLASCLESSAEQIYKTLLLNK